MGTVLNCPLATTFSGGVSYHAQPCALCPLFYSQGETEVTEKGYYTS